MSLSPSEYTLNGHSLGGAKPQWDQCENELERTKYAMRMLCECKYADVHRLLDTRKDLVRGLSFKQYWANSRTNTWEPNWKRREHYIGIAHYLFTDGLGEVQCTRCREFRNIGPFAKCINNGSETFGGACYCCYTACVAKTCPIRLASEERSQQQGTSAFNANVARGASTRVLEQTKRKVLNEMRIRGGDDMMELD